MYNILGLKEICVTVSSECNAYKLSRALANFIRKICSKLNYDFRYEDGHYPRHSEKQEEKYGAWP